jgi:hypothetical protein
MNNLEQCLSLIFLLITKPNNFSIFTIYYTLFPDLFNVII